MGKIRVKTLGIEEQEKEQKKEAKKRQEKKKLVKVPGLKGGERVVSIGPSEEELAKLEVPQVSKARLPAGQVSQVPQEEAKQKTHDTRRYARSKKYQAVANLVDKNKVYPLNQALELLPKLKLSTFDETVELHINTLENGISGTLTLPHGTGKKTRVAIADPTTASGQAQLDELLKKIEKGIVDFDVLIAIPDAMPKLAKVAKILGPRGLMPSPKNGTITNKPDELVKKYEAGQITFKTEPKIPIIHFSVGKLSFGEKKLAENIKTVLLAIQTSRIKKAVLKSTMSPGIKLDVSSIS